MKKHYQVAVIGGGINGVGVAREATMQGYDTLLAEKTDFAHATSGQTSKLIHGGIRYLEQGHFKLVKESLRERKILLKTAPHLVHPIRIHIPVYKGDARPAWMIWLGCKMYDFFAGAQNLDASQMMSHEKQANVSQIKQSGLKRILSYSDGQTWDSRLCLETALSAEEHGADVYNYMELIEAKHQKGHYALTFKNHRTQQTHQTTATTLINVGGPWAPQVEQQITQKPSQMGLEHVRGIHFVIRSITPNNEGFLLLPGDGRVVFTLPWMDQYTLVGTTESLYEGDNFDDVPASDEEVNYLLQVFNDYFPQHAITLDQVLHVYSGVRPILKSNESNMSKASREYKVIPTWNEDGSAYIGVYGGKLTTYRSLGESVIRTVTLKQAPAHAPKGSTQSTPLFGGKTPSLETAEPLLAKLKEKDVSQEVINHWQQTYGSQWSQVAQQTLSTDEGSRPVLNNRSLLKGELQYWIQTEKAFTLDDILIRRSKWAYELSEEEQQALKHALEHELQNLTPQKSPANTH